MWLINKVTVAEVPSVSVHALVDLERERTFTRGKRMRVSLPNTFQGYRSTNHRPSSAEEEQHCFRTKGCPFSYSL